MNSIKKGQKVWVLSYRYRGKAELNETEVSKVGRKYFYIDACARSKFYLDSLTECSEYVSRYKIYLNEQDYYDEKLTSKLSSEIISVVKPIYGKCDIDLDKLKKIADILGIEYKNDKH